MVGSWKLRRQAFFFSVGLRIRAWRLSLRCATNGEDGDDPAGTTVSVKHAITVSVQNALT
jgi:hypothetical protein